MATAVHAVSSPSYVPSASLLEKVAGDSFEALYRGNYTRVVNAIARIVHDTGLAEYIANGVWTKIWEKRDSASTYRGDSTFSTWVTRIAMNDALMHLRRERVASRFVSLDGNVRAGDQSEVQHDLPMRDLRLEGVIDKDALTIAIGKLTTPYRLVLVARLIDGMSTDETCRKLGLPKTVVKSRLHRSRNMLQKWLAKREPKK